MDGLVRGKLATRNVPGSNRRMINISLTDKGSEVCKRINSDNDEYFAEVLKAVPPGDMTVFLRSLESVLGRMIEANGTEKDPCSI